MPRITKQHSDLLDAFDIQKRQIHELHEAISPGRIANHAYYVGVAKRFRERATQQEATITMDWSPMRPPIPHAAPRKTCGRYVAGDDYCALSPGHVGDCEGF